MSIVWAPGLYAADSGKTVSLHPSKSNTKYATKNQTTQRHRRTQTHTHARNNTLSTNHYTSHALRHKMIFNQRGSDSAGPWGPGGGPQGP